MKREHIAFLKGLQAGMVRAEDRDTMQQILDAVAPKESAYPVLGQECICPDGLGRVAAINSDGSIHVETYINNRGCHWARHNVTLLPWSRA